LASREGDEWLSPCPAIGIDLDSSALVISLRGSGLALSWAVGAPSAAFGAGIGATAVAGGVSAEAAGVAGGAVCVGGTVLPVWFGVRLSRASQAVSAAAIAMTANTRIAFLILNSLRVTAMGWGESWHFRNPLDERDVETELWSGYLGTVRRKRRQQTSQTYCYRATSRLYRTEPFAIGRRRPGAAGGGF
jgi:hypothetical protein